MIDQLDVDFIFEFSENEEQKTKINFKADRFLNVMYQPTVGDTFKVNKDVMWAVNQTKVGCSIEFNGTNHHFPLMMKKYFDHLLKNEKTTFDDLKVDLNDINVCLN